MKLSQNFTLEELTFSQTAARFGIPNVPDGDTLDNLRFLAAMLEEVREIIGAPIIITSGYRNPAINEMVGGNPNSAHMAGLAADITSPRFGPPKSLARAIAVSEIQYDQVILEFPGQNSGWVHFGVALTNPRRQILTAVREEGRVVYKKGIQ